MRAVRNDLIAANVLVEQGRMGVIDREESSPVGLPLTDLAYALVDLAAATDGYRDRPAAFVASFSAGGSWASVTHRLIDGAAAAGGLEPPAVKLCLSGAAGGACGSAPPVTAPT